MTAFPDDYRALIEDARDAVCELLTASTPESWIGLRTSYGFMLSELRDDDRQRAREQQNARPSTPARSARVSEVDAAFAQLDQCWKPLTHERRVSLVLDVLGDDALTVREITGRISERFRTPECGSRRIVYETYARPLLRKMFLTGQIDRHAETRGKPGSKATRYRYSARRQLDGPIADLERAFHQDA